MIDYKKKYLKYKKKYLKYKKKYLIIKKNYRGWGGCWGNRDSPNCNVETIEINVINNSDGKTSKISISKNKSIFNEIQTYFKITNVFYGGIELGKKETVICNDIEDDAILYITLNKKTQEQINENTEEEKKIAEGWENALYNCDGDFWIPWKCNCNRTSFNEGYYNCRICQHPIDEHYEKNSYTGEKRYFNVNK